MKIGILGAGSIGGTLARKLSTAGHEVKVANSRGPETIEPDILAAGARAVNASDVVADVAVLITSIQLSRMTSIAPLIAKLPSDAVLVDTSNYYPHREPRIQALDDGQTESLWVSEQIGRPLAKAWNAIYKESFATQGKAAGHPDRLAVPVAADRDSDKLVAMALVEDTGFDAVDSGSLADSWRQQPGSPCYCTNLKRPEILKALAAADKARIPLRRDLVMAAVQERFEVVPDIGVGEYFVRLCRAICN
ncbi:NADPH-dependent F420 reductase [Paenarthrobacter aurescens]|uniref:NADPH-dependent F420 reductase n=1 Tax=Paenarthrobacter aurescens TaxID=43663 RepID=UPI0035E8EB79